MINLILILFFITLNLAIFLFFDKIKYLHLIKDFPNKKKIHKQPVSLSGGIIITFNLLIYFILNQVFNFSDFNNIFYFGCFFIFVLGLIDDKFDLSYKIKFILLFLIFSTIFVYNFNFRIESLYFETLDQSFNIKKFSFFFTILCLLLFSNALNMFDGINLQSINFSIILIIYFLIKNPINFLFLILIILVILLILNFKNKLFLGNSGSYLLSFIISYLIITNYNNGKISSCEEIFILLMLPGIDMLRLFIERIFRGKNPFKGDTNHYHHILIKNIKFSKTTKFTLIIMILNIVLIQTNIEKLIIIILSLLLYILTIYNKKFRKILKFI